MPKQKSIDYILGMITEASLIIAVWACISEGPLNAAGNTIQDVKFVNQA
jgi:hypothetical protein